MHIKQLDGIRCVAVAAVLIAHTFFYPFIKFFDFGKAGVDIFFTLSGFLITGILLREKKKMAEGSSSLKKSLFYFYIRRFLRIFPLYYSVIFIALIFNYYPARECIIWLLTFTGNWEIAHSFNNLQFLDFSHFWSLAVEEQFYVFFPFLILFVTKKNTIRKILLLLALGGIGARSFFFCYAGNPEYAAYFSTAGCLDVLSLGALLAVERDRISIFFLRLQKQTLLLLTVVLVLLFITGISFFKETGWGIIMGRTFTGLLTCWLIMGIIWEKLPLVLNRFLLWKPVVYIGKISFGIYVFHPFVIRFFSGYVKEKLPLQIPITPLIFLSVFLLASLSWEFFEKQVLKYKNRYIT